MKIASQTMCQNIVFYKLLFYYYDMKIDVTEKYSKFIINFPYLFLIFRKLEIPTEIVDVLSLYDPIKSNINHHHCLQRHR